MTLYEMIDAYEEYCAAVAFATDAMYEADAVTILEAWRAADAAACEIRRAGFKDPHDLAAQIAVWKNMGQSVELEADHA